MTAVSKSITATRILVSVLLLLVAAGTVHATIDAKVTISSQDVGGGVFNYTLTLDNLPTSTSPVQTLWYSWIPGLDFMSVAPITESAPSGWDTFVESGTYYGGYSLRFTTTTDQVNPGSTRQFGFTSSITPAELAGNDHIFGYYPEDTTYLYSVSIESGDSVSLVAETVPEPSTLALVAIGTIVAAFSIAARKSRPQLQML